MTNKEMRSYEDIESIEDPGEYRRELDEIERIQLEILEEEAVTNSDIFFS